MDSKKRFVFSFVLHYWCMKTHIKEKQTELIRALGIQQDYSLQEVADIFGVTKSHVYKIVSTTNKKDYVCPWVKRDDI